MEAPASTEYELKKKNTRIHVYKGFEPLLNRLTDSTHYVIF